MSDEKQEIDPALLGDNPAGLDPADAINGMELRGKTRGIKKINKKGLMVVAGILGGAAIVATSTFNGTGSAVNTAAKDAVAHQAKSRPVDAHRDNLWYATVPDKMAAGEPEAAPNGQSEDLLGINQNRPAASPGVGAGGTAVPDLTGKAISPLAAATAGRTGAPVYRAGTTPAGAQPGAADPEAAAREQERQMAVQQAEQKRQMAAQQAEQARQLRAQILDQASKSNLAASGFGEKPGTAEAPALAAARERLLGGLQQTPAGALAALGGLGQAQQRDDDQNKQGRKEQFIKAQEEAADKDYNPSQKTAPRSPYEVKAGGVIPAVMIGGLNSDLPGEAIAQVRENVYDTATGRHLLIPFGSRLIGKYDSQIAFGQQRVLVAWQRIIFQDGSSVSLNGMRGADMSGYAGFSDKVDNHYARIFGSAALVSILGAGVQLSQPNNGGGNNNNQPSVSQTIGASLGQQIGQTGMNITQKNLNVQATLEIRNGYRFNVMIAADMILPPVVK